MYLYMKIRNHASKTRKEINRLSYINYLHYLPKQATPSLHIFLHKELTSIGRRNIPERFTTDTGIPLTPGHPPVDYRMASLKRATRLPRSQHLLHERRVFRTGLCPPSRGAILLAGPRRHYFPFPLPITLCVHLVNQARYCIHDAKSARLIVVSRYLLASLHGYLR